MENECLEAGEKAEEELQAKKRELSLAPIEVEAWNKEDDEKKLNVDLPRLEKMCDKFADEMPANSSAGAKLYPSVSGKPLASPQQRIHSHTTALKVVRGTTSKNEKFNVGKNYADVIKSTPRRQLSLF